MTSDQSTDAQLVFRTLNGEREAFATIIARYQSLICALSYSATGNLSRSEEIAHEVFVTGWTRLESLQEPARLKAWLCGIARNHIQEFIRGECRHRERSVPLSEDDAKEAPDLTPSEEAVRAEEEALLWRSLRELPLEYREPLVLFYREQESVEQVALALELSKETVRQRLSRGRRLLHKKLIGSVEETLRGSGPRAAFGVGVLAALPSVASPAAAAAGGTIVAQAQAGWFAGMAGKAAITACVAAGAAVGIAVYLGAQERRPDGSENGAVVSAIPDSAAHERETAAAPIASAALVGLAAGEERPAIIPSDEANERSGQESVAARNDRLREAFDEFPLLEPLQDEYGRAEFIALDLKESSVVVDGVRYGGFRIVADRGEEEDFLWTFLGPRNHQGWFLLPENGEMESFRNLVQRRHRGSYRRSAGLEPLNYTRMILQRLRGHLFAPGESYLILFRLRDDEPAPMSLAFVFAPRTEAGTVAAVEHALALRQAAREEDPRVTALRGIYDEASTFYRRGETKRATDLYEDLLEKAREIDQSYYIYQALTQLGNLRSRVGETARAIEFFEEALPWVRENVRRTGISRHFHEWSIFNLIISRHLDRGSLAAAQNALWRAEDSILRHVSDFGPEFAVADVSELEPRHLEGFTDISTLARILLSRSTLLALAGEGDAAIAGRYHVIELLENRRRIHQNEQRRLASAYYVLAITLSSYSRFEERERAIEKLRAMDPQYAESYQNTLGLVHSYNALRRGDGDVLELADTVEEMADMPEDARLGARLSKGSAIPRVIASRGDVTGGLALMDEIAAEAEAVELENIWAGLLLARAELRLDFGVLDGVEEDLFRVVEFYRRNGMLLQEPGFYRLYVRYLFARERLDEIPAILSVAFQRAERFQLRDLQEHLRKDYERWKEEAARNSPQEERAILAGIVDLQPLEMISHASEGELVRGRFSLVNLGMVPVEGTLRVIGPVEADAWNAAGDVWAVAVGREGDGRRETLSLKPGERRVIYVETLLGGAGESRGTEVRWEGSVEQSSWWRCETERESSTVSVVQASLAMENPFYSVPLYQEIYYRGAGERVADFRIRSSHPAHIEAIDADSGRLLAIDSSGNGLFNSLGDAIFQDRNRNGYPDLLFDQETDIAAIELHVFPHSTSSAAPAPDEILVYLEIRDESGQWRSERENRLITGQQ